MSHSKAGDQLWEAAFAALLEYARTHGNAEPSLDVHISGSCRKGADQRSLGHWVRNQRQVYGRGQMDPARRQALESIPGWTWRRPGRRPRTFYGTGDDRRAHMAGLLATWIRQHDGRFPSHDSKDRAEVRLSDFITQCRAEHRDGTLPPTVAAILKTIPCWRWTYEEHVVARHEQRMLVLATFALEHGHWPDARSDDPAERRLGLWWERRRKFFDDLPPHQQRYLEMLEDAWVSAFWRDHHRQALQLAAGEPTDTPSSRLRAWVRQQRRQQATLTPCQRELLAGIPEHVDDPRTHTWRTRLREVRNHPRGKANREWLSRARRQARAGTLAVWQVEALGDIAPRRGSAAQSNLAGLHASNTRSTAAAAERTIQLARVLLLNGVSGPTRAVLKARVDYPTESYTELAARLGMTKDKYFGYLRRALKPH